MWRKKERKLTDHAKTANHAKCVNIRKSNFALSSILKFLMFLLYKIERENRTALKSFIIKGTGK